MNVNAVSRCLPGFDHDCKTIKVLFLDYQFRSLGGLETYNMETVRAFQRLGVNMQVWSCFTSGNQVLQGIPTSGLAPLNSRWSKLYQRFWRLHLCLRLIREQPQVDLVIVGHVFLVCQGLWWAHRRNIPCWLLVFGVDIWNPLPLPFNRAISHCDRIVAVSGYTARRAAALLPDTKRRLSVIHPAVDTARFRPSPVTNFDFPKVVLTVARLSAGERYKGHELVILALPTVREALGESIEYWVVGTGDDRPRLESLASRCGVSDSVRFLGRVDDNQLLDCYQRCHVFAMPSFVTQRSDGFHTGEGFGIVYLEASACAKPVLAANEGGQTEAVRHGETGLLVKPTVTEVAQGLIALLGNPELSKAMGRNGRKFVEQDFTMAHFEARWRVLLKESFPQLFESAS